MSSTTRYFKHARKVSTRFRCVNVTELSRWALRVLVGLGYGYVPPMGLFPDVNPVTVGSELLTGVQQGFVAALVDVGALPSSDLPDSYPHLPAADAPAEMANSLSALGG